MDHGWGPGGSWLGPWRIMVGALVDHGWALVDHGWVCCGSWLGLFVDRCWVCCGSWLGLWWIMVGALVDHGWALVDHGWGCGGSWLGLWRIVVGCLGEHGWTLVGVRVSSRLLNLWSRPCQAAQRERSMASRHARRMEVDAPAAAPAELLPSGETQLMQLLANRDLDGARRRLGVVPMEVSRLVKRTHRYACSKFVCCRAMPYSHDVQNL